jgi:hypothetical protein
MNFRVSLQIMLIAVAEDAKSKIVQINWLVLRFQR